MWVRAVEPTGCHSGFVVTCRDLAEVATQGDDMDEAMAMAEPAREFAVADLRLLHRGPQRRLRRQQRRQRHHDLAGPRPLVRRERGGERVDSASVTEGLVRRRLNFKHRSHIGQLETAPAALGKRLVVEVQDAA